MNQKILLLFIFVLINMTFSNIAWAYCVYNNSSIDIMGYDTRYDWLTKYWMDDDLKPGEHSCCPGDHPECQNAAIRIGRTTPIGEITPYCYPRDTQVAAHGDIYITGDNQNISCATN